MASEDFYQTCYGPGGDLYVVDAMDYIQNTWSITDQTSVARKTFKSLAVVSSGLSKSGGSSPHPL